MPVRGDRRAPILLGDDDRWMHLRSLGKVEKRSGIRIHADALMDNHHQPHQRLDFRSSIVYTFLMPDTYNMKEAQAGLTKLCRSGKRFVIANRNEPVVVALPVADFEALMETLDVLGDPNAMKVIHAAQQGESTYRTLDLDDENFGL